MPYLTFLWLGLKTGSGIYFDVQPLCHAEISFVAQQRDKFYTELRRYAARLLQTLKPDWLK